MNKKAAAITFEILLSCAMLIVFTVNFPWITLGVFVFAVVSWLVFVLYLVVDLELTR